jgi:CRP/FNR family transcriptional regulator
LERLRKHIEEILPLTDDEFNYIKDFFTLKRVRKSQYLASEGDEVKYEFLVLSGLYKVFFLDELGKEHVIQFAKENWWMSDYYAFFRQEEGRVFIECIEPGEVVYSTYETRERLASEFHKMEHFYRVKLTNGYVAMQERVKLLLSSSPMERYDAFSEMYPDLLPRLPKKLIAEYLGVSRETLSRFYSK